MSFELEPQTGQHVQKMAPKKTTKKGAPKRTLLEKKTAVRRSKRIADQQLEKRLKKLEEKTAKLKKSGEKQKDMVEEFEDQLEQLRETVEEHVEDGGAHHFEDRLEKLKESMEEQHAELRGKIEKHVRKDSTGECEFVV